MMKSLLTTLGAVALWFLFVSPAQAASFTYSRSITVTSTISIASGTNVNFPMLVSSTLTSWKSAGNGGNIQNVITAPNGGTMPADLVFATSTSNCTNGAYLNWEIEKYTSSTGALVSWVNVPSMATGAVIYACYDAAAVSTDQSHPSLTWDSNYKGVWHYADNIASTTVIDSTNNGNGTSFHNTNVVQSPGQVDGGFSMVAGNSDNVAATNPVPLTSNNVTVSFWYKPASVAAAEWITYFGNTQTGDGSTELGWVNQFGTLLQYSNGGGYTTVGNISVGQWYYVVTTGNSTANTAYMNALGVAGGSNNGGTNSNLYIGSGFTPGYTTANFDEVRISNVLRSSSWITTEYNNQLVPDDSTSGSGFYHVGTETAFGGGGGATTTTRFDNFFFISD